MVATDAGSAVSTQATEGDTTASDTTTSIERVVATTDHEVVGRLFVGFGFLALMFSLVGAALAQLGGAADPLLGAWSQGVGTSSSLGIITMGILPVSIGLGLYLVPLQIGSKSSSFPRGALLAFWTGPYRRCCSSSQSSTMVASVVAPTRCLDSGLPLSPDRLSHWRLA